MMAVLAGAGAMVGTTGCRRGEIVSGVTDSTFVAAMSELRRVESAPTRDSASRAAARAAVLQRQGLTPAELERAARALAGDPERATEIWRAIDRRANSTPGSDANPPGNDARRKRTSGADRAPVVVPPDTTVAAPSPTPAPMR